MDRREKDKTHLISKSALALGEDTSVSAGADAAGVVLVKRYRLSYKHGVVSAENDARFFPDSSKPMVMAEDYDSLLASLAAEKERNRKLCEALERYGRHRSDDQGYLCELAMHSESPCTCGLDAILTSARSTGDV